MLYKFITYAWSIRREFTKYFIVGVTGVVIDIGTLMFLKERLNFLPVIAVMVNQLIVMSYNFLLNKYWSFRNQELPHKQFVRYIFVSTMNYGVGVAVMYFFNHYLNFDYRLVRIGTIVVMVPANFLLYKYWVYRSVTTQIS